MGGRRRDRRLLGRAARHAQWPVVAREICDTQQAALCTQPLPVAIWADYKPEFYWWELTELCRRFILLGLFVNLSPGSVLQLMLGTVVSAAYLVLQLFAQPFKLTSLNYTSGLASFSIVVFFISALIFKVNALVDQHEVSIVMT